MSDLEVLRQVDGHYNHLTSLRTHFTETYAGLGTERTESGTLLLKKPGRMRWNYTEPAGKVFVLDGRYAWSYAPGDAEVQRLPAKQMDDLRSPLRFLLGHTQLQKELDGIVVKPEEAGYRISGVPKGMSQRVRQLVLAVTADGRIRRILLEETDGARTQFIFDDSEENIALPEADFRFTPPSGTSVVEGTPPI